MDTRHDELALSLVAEACLAVDQARPEDENALSRLELLRAELQSIAYCCSGEPAREALLAVELIEAVLDGVPARVALAS